MEPMKLDQQEALPSKTRILNTVHELLEWRQKQADPVGFVPTMGCLHEGHLQLVRNAQDNQPVVIVSIFVNPLQFGPQEDFECYPRILEEDLIKLTRQGVQAVFCPSVEEIYPSGQPVCYVEHSELQHVLCGAFRPNFFRGVLTVLTKLFHLINPKAVYLGEKDYQQLILVRHMVKALFFPTKVVGVATVRDQDGLALSSRNRYLSPEERSVAPQLYQGLVSLKEHLLAGQDIDKSMKNLREQLEHQSWVLDYLELRDADTLQEYSFSAGQGEALTKLKRCIIVIAARLGKNRLLDNLWIDFPHEKN
jgi:pantoate--beta-alanine ligase